MKATKEQIARLDRLKKRSDFLRVQKEGQRWVSKGLILQAMRRAAPEGDSGAAALACAGKAGAAPSAARDDGGAGIIRFGLTASRKLSRKAVVRNRVRRRLRALARDILPVAAAEGADYVLIGRAETETRPYDELCRDLRWCLRRMAFAREARDEDKKSSEGARTGGRETPDGAS